MDQDHCRGSMGPVQISGQWTGSKMGERGGGGGGGPSFVLTLYGMQHVGCTATLSNRLLVTRIMPLRKLSDS